MNTNTRGQQAPESYATFWEPAVTDVTPPTAPSNNPATNPADGKDAYLEFVNVTEGVPGAPSTRALEFSVADRFYTPDLLGPGEYVLTGPEAHHLATVRRFAPGDTVILFNGDGHEYPSEIFSVSKRTVALRVLAREPADRELGFPVVVGSSLPKGDRADFLIEKLTELGVTRFVPLVTVRAVVQPKPNVVEKLTRAVIEASKQCGRNRLLEVDPPQKWDAFVSRTDLPKTRFVLHTSEGGATLAAGEGCAVAVGPEGGFTPEEIVLALANDWLAASLGPRVLRVETAAIAATALLSSPQRGVG